MTRSALSSGTPEVERSGEKDWAVWIFCKGQCNFIIIQRVHTLSHTQRIMYAEMCLDLCTAPQHAPAPVQASGSSEHRPASGTLVQPLAHAYPAITFRHVVTPRQTRRPVQMPRER